jgi:hypothetical protein
VSLKDVERTLNKARTADSNAAIRKGSVLAASGNVPAVDIPFTSFTAREQRRAAIMTDIARLAQQPLQRSMPGASHCFRIPYSHITVTCLLAHIFLYSAGKDGSPSPSSSVTNISVQYVLSHTWNPTDLFSRYAQARSSNHTNVFTINALLAAELLAHLIWLRSQSSSMMRTPHVILTRCSPFFSVYNRELIEQQIEMHFCLASSLTDHLSTLCIAEEVRVSTRLWSTSTCTLPYMLTPNRTHIPPYHYL